MIRRKDRKGRLTLTDISSPAFDPRTTGKTRDELMREIHGRFSDGRFVTGVEVFREIYTRLGFGFLVFPSRIPGLRWMMDKFYNFFAGLRYRSALKRLNRRVCPLPSQRKVNALKAFPDALELPPSTSDQQPS